MVLKNTVNVYNLLLSLGAFYLGLLMYLERGVFDTFPEEWIGIMPFNNWAGLAIFGIIVFGIGNAVVSAYGFIKKNKKIFVITISIGLLLLLCAVSPIILLGEWYLPIFQFLLFGSIQILLGLIGLLTSKS